MRSAAVQSPYFAAPSFFEALLPSAQNDSDTANSISSSDPVLAVEKYLPDGQRKIHEAKLVATTLLSAHAKLLPQLRDTATQLETAGYQTGWIDERLTELTQRGDALFREAVSGSIIEEAEEFATSVTNLGERAAQCREMSQRLVEEFQPSVTQLSNHIDAGRQELTQSLQLAPADALHERLHDPDAELNSARLQIEAIKAAIHRGNVEAANDAAAALQSDVSRGTEFVNDSLQALKDFESTHRLRQEACASAEAMVPTYEQKVAEAQQRYAGSALEFVAADPSYPQAGSTIASHVGDNRNELTEAERLVRLSHEFFHKGRVLEAMAMLAAVDTDIAEAETRFAEIDRHLQLLHDRERANDAAFAKTAARAGQLQDAMNDRRTTQATQQSYRDAVQHVQSVGHEVQSQSGARHPFEVAARIQSLDLELDKMDAQLVADRNAHAEASRAIESAFEQARRRDD